MFMILKQACPSEWPKGARCVQRFDDSLNSAIHITYRISLRSSSMREPRDPLLKVVFFIKGFTFKTESVNESDGWQVSPLPSKVHGVWKLKRRAARGRTAVEDFSNDPSAGSPTETLLRLLLPLKLGHRPSSQYSGLAETSPEINPEASALPPIGSSDGRCVQRAGT